MTITRTDLAELAVFAAVARHQSFSKAALELGVSASALSHSLKGLETRLGVRLLNRSTRAVVPTDAGQRLLTQLLPTLSHLESALDELARHSDEPVGRLKISAPRGAIDELLAPVLIDYMVRYPRMQVEVVEQELMPRLIEDGYDAALFYGDLLPKEMIGVPLGPPQRYLVVAAPAYLAEHGIHKVYISLPMSSQPRVMRLLDELQDSTASIYFVPDFFIFDMIQAHVDHVAGIPVVCICESPFRGLKAVVKRASDLVFGSIILAMIWPIMLATAIAVKVTSKGPVIFKQRRYGADGKSIMVYKFRSMRADAEKNGAVWASAQDARVTRFGKFIRKVRIDELPQIWNILKGDMSFIGPRPERMAFVTKLKETIPYYSLRHTVKPGLTGWAQVCYPYGASIEDARYKLEYDLYYSV